MKEVLFSPQQYQAVLERLDEITKDVTLIKDKTLPEAGYIDNHDLMILLQITPRTLQRWRKNGLIPYRKLGSRFFYKADLILKSFKAHTDHPDDDDPPPPAAPLADDNELHITCKQCPLFVILNSED